MRAQGIILGFLSGQEAWFEKVLILTNYSVTFCATPSRRCIGLMVSTSDSVIKRMFWFNAKGTGSGADLGEATSPPFWQKYLRPEWPEILWVSTLIQGPKG